MCAHYTIFIEEADLREIVEAAEANLAHTNPAQQMSFDNIYPGKLAPVLVYENGKSMPGQ